MSRVQNPKEIVESSGNNFLCKVLRFFNEEAKEWHTLVSPYYMDTALDKPREIDLVVEKVFAVPIAANPTVLKYCVKLYIECKYIPQTMVFWFADKDMQRARGCVLSNPPMKDKNEVTNQHHYLRDKNRVAKLFACGTGGQPKKPENEVIYLALTQSLHSLVYGRFADRYLPKYKREDTVVVRYPVIVCNSFNKFYRVEVDSDADPSPIKDNFQLEVDYAYLDPDRRHNSEFFLIDVIEFDQLDKFIEVIERDLSYCIANVV